MNNENNTKRSRTDAGDHSATSPLANEKKENDGVILISSSHHEADNTSNRGEGNWDDWHPLLFKSEKNTETGERGLEQRLEFLENEFRQVKQSQHNLTEYVMRNETYKSPDKSIPVPFKNPLTPGTSKKPNKVGMSPTCTKELRVRILFSPSPSSKNTRNKVVVTDQTPSGYHIVPNTKPGPPSKLIGLTIPDWLSAMFKPEQTMTLSYEECAVASYIFGPSKTKKVDENEVMVTTEIKYCQGTRSLIQSLKPKAMIGQDIIDLAVSMLTCNNKYMGIWFLPSTFSQYVLTWNKTTNVMMKKFKMFMGKVDLVAKIFLPVHDYECKHWFLVVIDLVKKEIVLLDSFPATNSTLEGRRRSIKKLALYMEELLMDPSFYDFETKNTPLVSEFDIVTPNDLGTQADYSNDCGIWVISWMEKMGFNGYKIDVVDDGTRLRIALDLTMNSYNKLANDVLSKALQYMID